MTDRIRTAPDVRFQPRGVGIQPRWLCMGCNKPRSQDGSKGQGIFKRCAECAGKGK